MAEKVELVFAYVQSPAAASLEVDISKGAPFGGKIFAGKSGSGDKK